MTLREVALCSCVAQALHMCSVALTAALRQRVSAAAPKWGPFSGPEKGPKAANPNCWGSDFWGLFFVRKMGAKLAPPFDFGVALAFMRKGCFLARPAVFLLSCLQLRHSSPCVLPRGFPVFSLFRCLLASWGAPGRRGMHPRAWLKLGGKKVPARVRASASRPRSPVWRPSPAFPLPCPAGSRLKVRPPLRVSHPRL